MLLFPTGREGAALTSDSGSWIRSLPSQTRKQHGVQQLRQAADCTAKTEDNCRTFTPSNRGWRLDRPGRGVQSPGEQDAGSRRGEDGAEEEVQGSDGAGPASVDLTSYNIKHHGVNMQTSSYYVPRLL